MVQVSLNMGWAILNAAGLSFIGLGVRPPTPEWGILVAEGAQFIVSGEWWVSFFPGAVLMLAVFSFNLLGDALRDIFDPRERRSAHDAPAPARRSLRASTATSSLEFRTRSGTVRALEGIDLQLHKGEIVGLVGESGSGKSVLSLRAAGHQRPRRASVTGGSAMFGGMDLLKADERDAGRPARPRDLDDLPEPAHRAQPDPPRRPADRGRAAPPRRRARRRPGQRA